MRVLVTGSRDWTDEEKIRRALHGGDYLRISELIHGDCPKGADRIAAKIARRELCCSVRPFPAEWSKYGKRAGPIRNRRMLSEKPDVVYAFPIGGPKRGSGTWDCIGAAIDRGIRIVIFPNASSV